MNPAEYERMFALEDHYWWFVARRELVRTLVRRHVRSTTPTFLDVGCGTGATAQELARIGQVIALDSSPLALRASASRGLSNLIRGRAESIPLPDSHCDAVIATDVLEHLDDDRAALAEFRRVLKPGGHALITVPAFSFLWSEHDVALMHRRRYVARQLATLAARTGFEPRYLGYALSFLFPLALVRLLKRPTRLPARVPEAQIQPVPGWLNSALIRLQRIETSLFRLGSLPWGLSVVAVLRRPP
ncbi:MAG: methyltransferase [Isosphaeraceae bacterium]|jgi:ubiquinone/menaquinone biosynthesis C-methylase UbiE|nr:MAG: methyltransferase [Isosphaeraceae bacterium]